MDKDKLKKVLDDHLLWLSGNGGARANLVCANMKDANLSGANLVCANMKDANLKDAYLVCANFSGANLEGAYLAGAYLNGANLTGANLEDAYLVCANLKGAYLVGADLTGANLTGAKWDYLTIGIILSCPEEGTFIAWKKCNGKLIKLLIPEHAKRSSATTRKCRASSAVVLDIIGDDKTPIENKGTIYEIGKEAFPDKWDDNRWNECSNGIHFFMNRSDAESWKDQKSNP